MKMTRDAEYDLVHEMESSLMELMSSSLKQRLTAEPVRFVYQRDMPDAMVEMLRDKPPFPTTTHAAGRPLSQL